MSRWRSRGRSIGTGLAFGLAVTVAAARPTPDWLAACLAEKASGEGIATLAQVSARGAAAIVLLDSTEVRFVSSDRMHQRRRLAAWVSAGPARNGGLAAQGYNPDTEQITAVNAWVVSADGKRTRHFGRGDLVDSVAVYSKYFWDSARVVRLDPSDKVDIGGVVAWEIESDSPAGVFDSSCRFQSPYYLWHGVFDAVPAPNTTLIWHASSGRLGLPRPGAGAGSLHWEISDVAPHPVGRPTGFFPNLLEVSVRCQPAAPDPSFARDWRGESRLIAGVIEPQTRDNDAIKAEAGRQVSGRKERWDRVRALTDFVQRDIVYLSVTMDKDVLAGCRPHPSDEVLRSRVGDCKDKATLLVSLLRAEGEAAKVVLVYAENPTAIEPQWPTLSFNHAIVAVRADDTVPASWPVVQAGALGKMVLFDPTNPYAPLGVLSWSDDGGYGLIVDRENGALVRFPAPDPAFCRRQRMVRAHLEANGALQADVDDNLFGQLAAQDHAVLLVQGRAAFRRTIENLVHRGSPLAQNLQWSDVWDPAGPSYSLRMHFRIDHYLKPIDEASAMISPELLPVGDVLRPWSSAAEGVVWLRNSAEVEDVTLPIPPGYRVEEMPDPWRGAEASTTGAISYRTASDTVTYRLELNQPAGFFTRPKYKALRAFYEKLREAQRRPILFRRSAAS